MKRLTKSRQDRNLNEVGINMVDLMMWLVIAAMLLAAALQSISYYQKTAYVYQMNAAVEVTAGKITAAAATDGTVVTQEIIDRIVAEENEATPKDQIVLTAGSLASYASGTGETSQYGFDRTSVTTAPTGGQSRYIKATHAAITDRESSYFFQATASYKAGVNVLSTGTLETPAVPAPTTPAPTPSTTTSTPTPPPVMPDFSKDPEWTQQTGVGTNVWYGVAVSADGMKMATAPSIDAGVGNNGGHIRTSTDGGVTWTEQLGSPYANWRSVASSADGSILVAGTWDNPGSDFKYTLAGTYRNYVHISRDSGVTWNKIAALPSGRWYGISVSPDGNHMFAVDASTVNLPNNHGGYPWVSHDSGATWTKVTNVNGTADSGRGVWFPVSQSSDGQRLVTAKYNGYIYNSNDGGVTWSQNTSVATPQTWARFAASADGSTILATTLKSSGTPADTGKLYISKDFGATFVPVPDAGVANWTAAAISADGTKMIAGQVTNPVSGGELKFSVDGGQTWTTQNGVPTNGTWYNAAMTPDGTKMITGNSVAGQSLYTGIVK